jgi:hypothetical protein
MDRRSRKIVRLRESWIRLPGQKVDIVVVVVHFEFCLRRGARVIHVVNLLV